MSKAKTLVAEKVEQEKSTTKNIKNEPDIKVMKEAQKAVLNKMAPEKINMSRRYFTIGVFASVILFKKKLINPSYQISRTGKFTIKLSIIFYKMMKFILWSATKK